MSKSSTVTARIQPDLKANVEEIFQQLGLTTTEAITLFYQQVALHKGLPFAVKTPNEITEKTFQKTDQGEELISCQSVEDMSDLFK